MAMSLLSGMVGIEPETLWSSLLAASSLPAWITAPGPPRAVRVMSWDDALRTIQSHYRVSL